MCRELSRCLYSLSSAGDAAGRNLITLFRTVNNFAHFFFRQVGVASRPSPVRTTRRTTTTTIAVRLHRRHDFRKPLFLRGLRKTHRRNDMFDDAFASMRRGRDSHPESRFETPEKNLRRRPRFASHKPDLRESARTPTRCRRRFDDHPTRSRTSHRACRRRPSRCSGCTSSVTRIAPDEADDTVRRVPGTCRSSRRAGPPARSIRCFRDGVRWVAHRTVTFRNAHRVPQKQNRPHEAAGR